MTNDRRGGFRRFIAFLVGNWAARIYLALVIAAGAFVVLDSATSGSPDASFAGVPLLLVTLPGSLMSAPLIDVGPYWLNPVVGIAAVVVGALINTAVISGIVWIIRNRNGSAPAPDGPPSSR